METFKEFCTILLRRHITVYTDHKNITFENFTTERVLRWCLMLEEYGLDIKYTKGPDNEASYALSRLLLINFDVKQSDITRENLSERYCVKKLYSNTFPLTQQTIDKYQQKC